MPLFRTAAALILISCCLTFSVAPAPAVEKPVATGNYALGEVVVEAPPAGNESMGVVREIDAAQIEAMNARTLDQVLKMVPGLVVRIGAEGVPRVDMRGFRSRHVVLLLNGVPFNSTYDGQFDPSLIPTENIARIKVSYGTHSVLYGQGGLGGVINIITKAGGVGSGASLKAEGGQGSSFLGAVTAHTGNDKANLFVSASHAQRDNWPVSDHFSSTSEQDRGARVGSEKSRSNLFADLQYNPTPNWLLGISGGGLAGRYQQPPSTINDKKDEFANSPKYDAVEGIGGAYGQAALAYQGDGPFSFRSWGYVNHLSASDKRYDDANYNSMTDSGTKTYDLDTNTNIYGLNLQGGYDLKKWGQVTMGLKGEQHKWSVSGRSRDQRIGKTKKYDWRTVDDDKDLNIFMAALEYKVNPLAGLDLTAGVSFNWLDKEGTNQDGASYMAGARYAFATGTTLRGSYGRTVRFPSLRQLYDEEAGNSDLQAEFSDAFELGVEQALPYNILLTLTGFHTTVRDYIEKDASDIYRNNQKYRFQGIELTAQATPVAGLWLSTSYTYMETRDLSDGSDKDELQNRPRHKVAFQGQYRFPCGFAAYFGALLMADQVYYSKTTPLQQAKLNDFVVLDLKISQSLWKDRFNIYLGADNLLDADYETSYGYPSPGRIVYGGVGIKF